MILDSCTQGSGDGSKGFESLAQRDSKTQDISRPRIRSVLRFTHLKRGLPYLLAERPMLLCDSHPLFGSNCSSLHCSAPLNLLEHISQSEAYPQWMNFMQENHVDLRPLPLASTSPSLSTPFRVFPLNLSVVSSKIQGADKHVMCLAHQLLLHLIVLA